MRAVVARTLGPPETLGIETVARAPLGPAEARVGIHYAGVSFVDVLTAGGGYQVKPPTPFVPGSEFSGVVLEAGPEATTFAPGDRVSGGAFGGVFAEEIVVPVNRLQRVPAGASMAEASVLRASFFTAYNAVVDRAQVKAGETVLVLGAGGAVGVAAVQVAKAFGATVIASASSQAKRALALDHGATHAVDSNAPDWREQIKQLTGGAGLDIVVDPVGGAFTERAFRALRWGGRHLVIGFAAGGIPKLPTNLALLKGGALLGIDLRQLGEREPEALEALARNVARLFDAGAVRPPIARIYPLADFVAAMQAAAAGESAGRIVLRMPLAPDEA
jgi:NADPH2:quinone reductase